MRDMEFKGTKGKWHTNHAVMGGEDQIHILSERCGRSLAVIPNFNKEDEANAHLIAAAPELLNACIVALSAIDIEDVKAYDIVKNAISKALGK